MEEKFNFKIQDSVQWYEGQLLYPHHYQQMRYEIHQLSLCYLSLSSPWYWGVRYLEIDEVLLPTGILRINKILAVFPDGSVLQKEELDPQQTIELDITPLKEELKEKEITIYLAIVKHQADIANASGDFPRYLSVESSSIVDENTGESPINMAKLSLRAFLVTEDKLSARLSSFPLITLSLKNGAFQRGEFIFPTTQLHKEGEIGKAFGALITKIRRHIAYLAIRLQSIKTKETSSILDYYRTVYDTLVGRILILEALYESGHAHPYDLYKEINTMAGSCCSINHTKVPPVFAPYNHNDLKATFDPLIVFINEIVESIKSLSVSILFDRDDRVFHKEIKEDYLTSDTLVLGIHLGPNTNVPTGASWIKGAVIACDFSIQAIKEKRILGAERELVEQIPEMGLVSTYNQIFVKVKVDPHFIKAGETLRIFNPSDREDTRPDNIFLYVAG
jgi:type VI secretion system protein ImpJ